MQWRQQRTGFTTEVASAQHNVSWGAISDFPAVWGPMIHVILNCWFIPAAKI